MVANDADLLAETLAWIAPLADGAPLAAAAALRAIDAARGTSLEQGLMIEKDCYENRAAQRGSQGGARCLRRETQTRVPRRVTRALVARVDVGVGEWAEQRTRVAGGVRARRRCPPRRSYATMP